MKIAIYPGSFDPVTNGHVDIINRASKIVDKLIVSVTKNSAKKTIFSVEERIDLLSKVTRDIPNVEIISFHGLLVECAKEKSANLIIKGLRAISDFEYESQMALTNKYLAPDIETLFMLSSTQYQYLSSSIVREVAYYSGNINELVPNELVHIIEEKVRSAIIDKS